MKVCRAIAAEVNRRSGDVGEQDLVSISNALTAILPAGISRLESKELSTDEFRRLVNCDDPECTNIDDETVQWMIGADEGMNWYKHIVDTRPWNNLVVVFTHHSMHQRDDALLLLRRGSGGTLQIVSSPFGQPDDMCCDRSFDLFRVGNQLKIARPPSYEFFREEEGTVGVPGEDDYDLAMDVYDDPTKPDQSGGDCSVHYHLTSRLGVDDTSPTSVNGGEIAARIGREVDDMAKVFTLADEKGALRFAEEDKFIDPRTPSSEIKKARDFLNAQDPISNLTYDAMKVLALSGVASSFADEPDAESRWFVLSQSDTAYAALLMRGSGMIEAPFLALFKIQDGKLVPAVTEELKNVYRFAHADVGEIE